MKRMICVMLTLIMLVSLVPATAITASAASLSTSDAAITVLKKMTTFKDKCYRVADTQTFRIGYGTVCDEEHEITSDGKGTVVVTKPHTMTEKQADAALRSTLKEMDKKVNAFASSNKMSFKQHQHDALVLFSYDNGTAWMNGNGTLKTAIVNNAGVNELLNAMATVGGNMNRHKIEVNMYVDGTYSNVVPGIFAQVTYKTNGGSMPQGDGYTMYFDTLFPTNHVPTPKKAGYLFLGWYRQDELGEYEWMPKLNKDCADQTLTAQWQKSGLAPKDADAQALVAYSIISKSQLASRTFRTRPDVDEKYKVKDENGDSVKIEDSTFQTDRDYVAPDGGRWVRYSEGKWLLLSQGSDGTSTGDIDIDVTVTVTNSYVNRRVNASTASKINGSYKKGDKLRIISTDSGNGLLWGQVAAGYDDNTPVGWVALMYTNWNSVKDDPESSRDPEESNSKVIATATVTYPGYLQMRSEPGTDNKIVGSLYQNDTVEIYEIKTVNGHQWGRTNGGWICLTYTSLEMTEGNNNKYISSEGALAYTFTGKMTEAVTPVVSPSFDAEAVEDYYTKKDEDGKIKYQVWLRPEYLQEVTVTNMVYASDFLWARISWRVDLNRDGKNDTTKSGWVCLRDQNLSTESTPVAMNPTKFSAIVNGVTVREAADSGSNPIPITLNKGVEIQIHEIALTGENIWGRLSNEHVVSGKVEGPSANKNFDGWVNLASKYFQRNGLPTVDEDDDDTLSPIGKTATVIGASSVNVRITSSTTSRKVGSLAMGTTANVLEISDNGWYNLDIDVDGDPETGSWVSGQYLDIRDGYVNGEGPKDENGNKKPVPTYTGKGIVANTYTGVNVRSGAGTANPIVGKLLNGTLVDILEITNGGASKWGRVKEGWVCMDYITMLTEEVTYPETPTTPDGSQKTDSYEELDRTTTTAIYTGTIPAGTPIFAAPSHEYVGKDGEVLDTSFVTRTAQSNEKVTVYELLAVKELHMEGGKEDDGHGTEIEVTETSYWARIDDGYVFWPERNVKLNALDEKVHTVAGIETLNIRDDANGSKLGDPLKQGTQVKISALKIVQDKVWGRTDIERDGTLGWIRLDYTAEGAWVVEETKPTQPTPPAPPVFGDNDGTTGGFVPGTSGYRYKGTVTGAKEVNVRNTPASSGNKITAKLKNGASIVIYETTSANGEAWGRCDAGWIYLYYVNLTPVADGVREVHVMGNDQNYTVYTDADKSGVAGTYTRQTVVDVDEIVGTMYHTQLGWVDGSGFLK